MKRINSNKLISITAALLLINPTPKVVMIKAQEEIKEETIVTKEDDFKDLVIKEKETIDVESYNYVKKCFEVANGLVGMPGDCFFIVKTFVNRCFGPNHDLALLYEVDKPRSGDIIYYSNGGIGYEHWGVYLDEEHSLQGNFNGTTIIMDGYSISTCPNPGFYRVM